MKEFKKYAVLGILFILPLVAYLFFSRGVNNFVKLPTIKEGVLVETEFSDALTKEEFSLTEKINLITFFGEDVARKKVAAMNLKEKVYDKNKTFTDFQVITFYSPNQEDEINSFVYDINLTSDTSSWRFVEIDTETQKKIYGSLDLEEMLDSNFSTNLVYIVDKSGNLRGCPDDEDYGQMNGYNMSKIADLNNKMVDDVKVILAEYRLELKRLKANRAN